MKFSCVRFHQSSIGPVIRKIFGHWLHVLFCTSSPVAHSCLYHAFLLEQMFKLCGNNYINQVIELFMHSCIHVHVVHMSCMSRERHVACWCQLLMFISCEDIISCTSQSIHPCVLARTCQLSMAAPSVCPLWAHCHHSETNKLSPPIWPVWPINADWCANNCFSCTLCTLQQFSFLSCVICFDSS